MTPAETLQPHVAAIAGRAAALDADAAFPAEDVRLLASIGLPACPLPRSMGGAGAGTEPAGTEAVFDLLRLLGRANPSLGRLFEAHVNAIRLVMRDGDPAQKLDAAAACREGRLFGLWVTDAPGLAVHRTGGVLKGAKGPCSGAGHLRHALITADDAGETRMALVTLDGTQRVEMIADRLHGMRAAANGTVRLDNVAAPAPLGPPGAYMAEPDFSCGAWRTMAVTLGALDALTEAVRDHLRARNQAEAPAQQARFGAMLIAQETAALWTRRAAERAEHEGPVPARVAYVNLARIAVESACLDAMRHAQRAAGLAAMVRPNPIERLLRDLATYLRQPAPDEVLAVAAAHALAP